MTGTKKQHPVSTIHLRKLQLFGTLTYNPSVCILYMSKLSIIHEIIQTCFNQSKKQNRYNTNYFFLSIGILNNAVN